jgi:membrane protease subunit (stomatin/prohibitin family)
MAMKNKIASAALVGVLGMAGFGIATPALAGNAGAFIGGVVAVKVLDNMRDRTDAEQDQADAAQQAAAQQSSSSGSRSAEARIAELDKLAAGGYITPEEYKTKKKAILDSI